MDQNMNSTCVKLDNENPSLIVWSHKTKKVNWIFSQSDSVKIFFSINANVITIETSLLITPVPIQTVIYNDMNVYVSPFIDIYEEDNSIYRVQILFNIDDSTDCVTVHGVNMDIYEETINYSNYDNLMNYDNLINYDNLTDYNNFMDYDNYSALSDSSESSDFSESYDPYDYDEGYDSVS